MSSLVVERTFHIASIGGLRGGHRNALREGQGPVVEPQPTGRIPRIAKLMAMAIRCDQLLRSGTVPDASALARLAKVSQPRMTQILNLTLLAPDIQERLLFMEPVEEGKPDVSEKGLRRLCAVWEWERQHELQGRQRGSGAAEERCPRVERSDPLARPRQHRSSRATDGA